jgi:hypothetical protein
VSGYLHVDKWMTHYGITGCQTPRPLLTTMNKIIFISHILFEIQKSRRLKDGDVKSENVNVKSENVDTNLKILV